MTEQPTTTRRNAIRSGAATAAVVGLAGCTSFLGSGTNEVALGETVEDRVTGDSPRDPRYDDLAVPYELTLDSETRVRIRMQSDALDPYLVVTQDGASVAENDDGGQSLNSDLITTFDAGTYTIWAGSFSGEATGAFTLEVAEIEESDGTPTEISLGDSVDGTLTAEAPRDPVYDDLAVPYSLSVDEETNVRIRMTSDAVDAYLLVTRDGSTVAENDDGGDGLNSDLFTTLDAGTYTVWAGSFSGEDTGAYQLEVAEAEMQDVSPEPIELGETVEPTLTGDAPRDPVFQDLTDPWSFTLDSEQSVRIAMSSEDFDTYLLVTQDRAQVATDDDGGEGVDSDLVTTLGAGTYTIWAGSFSGTGTGDYTLTLEQA
jgi:hypothetical protein